MSLCAVCAAATIDGADLCDFHDQTISDDWAPGNRAWCDLLHRQQVPPAVEESPGTELVLVGTSTDLVQPY